MRRRWQALTKQHHVKLTAFPGDLVAAARKQADDVLGELAEPQRHHRQGARLLHGLPRPHRALVAGVDRGGAGGAGVARSGNFLAQGRACRVPALDAIADQVGLSRHVCAISAGKAHRRPPVFEAAMSSQIALLGLRARVSNSVPKT